MVRGPFFQASIGLALGASLGSGAGVARYLGYPTRGPRPHDFDYADPPREVGFRREVCSRLPDGPCTLRSRGRKRTRRRNAAKNRSS